MISAPNARIGGRLVVLAQDIAGAAAFLPDPDCRDVALAGAQVSAHFLGGGERLPVLPEGTSACVAAADPLPGGWRCSTLTLQPNSDAAYFDFIARALGPLADADGSGFHVTPTLDIILVAAGELELAGDAAERRLLSAGDVVQIHSARHRWRNVGTEAATLFCVQIGAERPAISREGP